VAAHTLCFFLKNPGSAESSTKVVMARKSWDHKTLQASTIMNNGESIHIRKKDGKKEGKKEGE
jgi:hypothetical protein